MNLKQWIMLIMFLIYNLVVGVYVEYIMDCKIIVIDQNELFIFFVLKLMNIWRI